MKVADIHPGVMVQFQLKDGKPFYGVIQRIVMGSHCVIEYETGQVGLVPIIDDGTVACPLIADRWALG